MYICMHINWDIYLYFHCKCTYKTISKYKIALDIYEYNVFLNISNKI